MEWEVLPVCTIAIAIMKITIVGSHCMLLWCKPQAAHSLQKRKIGLNFSPQNTPYNNL